jgi:carboxylate-amine ligase
MLEHIREGLDRLGDLEEVCALVQETLRRGNGADRQRAAFKRSGRLEDVVDELAAETCAGTT